MGTAIMADVDYALGFTRGEVPRAVPVICLEGDVTVANASTDLYGPGGKVTIPVMSAAAPIAVGDYVKLNVLASCEAETTEGMICVEKADAAGDFAIGLLYAKELTPAEIPTANVAGTVSDTGDIGPLLTNRYYYRGTAWIFCTHIVEGLTPTAGSTAIVPGNAVAPSVGNSYGLIYVRPGLSVADTAMYDDNGSENDDLCNFIAAHAANANTERINAFVGLTPVIMQA